MQRVDQMLEPPVVGKFYLVPTIDYWFYRTRDWYPIMGPKHDDKEHLEFVRQHYHPDWRFMPENIYRDVTETGEQQIYRWPLCHIDHPTFGPVVYKRRKCLRIPPPNTLVPRHEKGRALHRAWLGKDARPGPHGWVCPHRGTALGSVAPDAAGHITCPLHGLKFCAVTGKSVSTHAWQPGLFDGR